jgi:hypothetical protein
VEAKKHQQYFMRVALKKTRRNRSKLRCTKLNYSHVAMSNHITTSFRIQQLLEYHVFFGDDADNVNIENLVTLIPREMLFNFVGMLDNIHGIALLDQLKIFFSSKSINNRSLVFKRLVQLRKNNPQQEFILYSELTQMEIMRYAFAFSPAGNSDVILNINEEQVEMLFFKLMLIINEQIVRYKHIEKNSLATMCFMSSIINPVIRNEKGQDVRDRIAFQMELAINFFKMLSEEKFSHLYKLFLIQHNITNWEDYITTLFGIIAAGQYKAGRIDKDLNIDIDHLINKEVLTSISLPYNEIINYSATEKDNRASNSDYRVFRDKPIVTLKNGDFFIYNIEFTIDRIFNSLYFEFKSYNQSIESKIDITKLFTDIFCERIMFDAYMERCINKKFHIGICETKCKDIYSNKEIELGPPDYIVKEGDSLLLFECKDIRINGEVIETHDYEKIIQEYREKLFKKPNKKKFKRIGITQLTGHMESVRKGKFKWISVRKDIPIYPVLVLSDYKYVKMGFNIISNDWYQSSIAELDINSENNKYLIVMSFITLFKYSKLFKEKGFQYFFDLYINSITQNNIILQNQSFDYFMSQYQYDMRDLKIKILDIFHSKVKHNELSPNIRIH